MPISDILRHYIEITHKGLRKTARCPFHDDTNPSLNIDDNKGIWYCFVDNIGGDAIKFVQLHLNLGFIDALKDICQKLGWNWDEFDRGKKTSPKRERGYKILDRAMLIYRRYARQGNGKIFSSFLEERGLSEEMAENHGIGFAPGDNIFCQYLKSIPNEKERHLALELATELGIIRQNQYRKGDYYDTFKNRIVFPLWSHAGKVVGFTGRATLSEQRGKYINSSDSFLFNKNSVLYGLHEAKTIIRQKDAVILVEGHMDRIALASHGFPHSVAVMGTALGQAGLRALLGLSSNIYLALDGDEAGFKAAERINTQLMEATGSLPKYVDLSPCKDPDELIQQHGSLEFQKRLDEAQSMVDVCYRRILPETVPELTERKLDILRRLYGVVKPLGNGLQAREKIAHWARELGLQSDSESIFLDYELYCEDQRRSVQRIPPNRTELCDPQEPPVQEGEGETVVEHREGGKTLSSRDIVLLREAVLCPWILICKKFVELLDFTQNDEIKLFILDLKKFWDESDDGGEYERFLLEHLSGDEYSLELTTFVGGLLPKYRPTGHMDSEVLEKMVAQIKQKMKECQIQEKRKKLMEKQRFTQTQEESLQLLQDLNHLDREFAELKSERARLAH